MHKNPYWLAFLAIVAVCTIWYTVSFILAVQHYVSLSAEAPVISSQWSFEEVSADQYLPRAKYQFKIDGEVYAGETLLTQPGTRNPGSAKELIRDLREQQWTAWYDPSHPERSSLQKSLPIKECLSAVTLLGVFAYLMWLGYSIGMRRS